MKKLLGFGALAAFLYACFAPTPQPQTKTAETPKTTDKNKNIGGGNGGGTVPPTVSAIDFNIRAFQSCMNNGVVTKYEAISRTTGEVLTDVSFEFVNLESVAIQSNYNYCTVLNHDGGNGRYIAKLSRAGILKQREFYFSTCNHDGHETNCPENTNNVICSNYGATNGDTITLTWQGNFAAGQALNWYGDGWNEISRTDKTVTIQLTSFPAWIQAQPTAVSSNGFCHGWTGIYFC